MEIHVEIHVDTGKEPHKKQVFDKVGRGSTFAGIKWYFERVRPSKLDVMVFFWGAKTLRWRAPS